MSEMGMDYIRSSWAHPLLCLYLFVCIMFFSSVHVMHIDFSYYNNNLIQSEGGKCLCIFLDFFMGKYYCSWPPGRLTLAVYPLTFFFFQFDLSI